MIRPLVLAASLLAGDATAQALPASPPVVAPANLALGADIAASLLPDGTYQRMMGGTMAKMMDGLTGQMSAMPIAPFLKAAGLPPGDSAKLGQTTIKQIMDIVDPAYQQRMQTMMPVMMAELGKVMTEVEPQMRDGLAHAYATHFTSTQLSDIDRFLHTPSGSAFAAQNMTIATDPVVIEKMQAFMPKLIAAMPAIMQKATIATAGFPKPKTPDTLTEGDRARLATLLGVTPDKLKTTAGS